MTSNFKNFSLDIKGLGAVEFALILPFLLFLWMGVVELIELHLAGRKATIAVQTAADLIAQEQSITLAKLQDITAAVNAVMEPYPTANMGYKFASIEADIDGNVSVGWQFTQGNISSSDSVPAQALPLVTQNDSVIAAVITYQHDTIFDLIVPDVDLKEEAFSRPRRTLKIPLN